MDTNLDVLGIIKRAKQALNLKRDSELAEYLEVSRATVTNWGARNSIDFLCCLDKFGDKVDYNWLLLGKRKSANIRRDFAKASWYREKSKLYTIRKRPNQ